MVKDYNYLYFFLYLGAAKPIHSQFLTDHPSTTAGRSSQMNAQLVPAGRRLMPEPGKDGVQYQ